MHKLVEKRKARKRTHLVFPGKHCLLSMLLGLFADAHVAKQDAQSRDQELSALALGGMPIMRDWCEKVLQIDIGSRGSRV